MDTGGGDEVNPINVADADGVWMEELEGEKMNPKFKNFKGENWVGQSQPCDGGGRGKKHFGRKYFVTQEEIMCNNLLQCVTICYVEIDCDMNFANISNNFSDKDTDKVDRARLSMEVPVVSRMQEMAVKKTTMSKDIVTTGRSNYNNIDFVKDTIKPGLLGKRLF